MTPDRREVLRTGSGAPVTVFAHGLAASIAETRPFGSGLPGTRAFFGFHGLTYSALADELRSVADDTHATRAVGVSLGAGAVLRLAADQPDRFERLVLVLPASLDTPRPESVVRRLRNLANLVDAADVSGLTQGLLGLQPAAARQRADVRAWAAQRAADLAGTPVARTLRAFSDSAPLTDRAVLASCRVPVLVLGQEDDDAHPVGVAREVTAALPAAELVVLPPGGLLWAHRREVRAQVTGFLGRPGDSR